MNSSPPIDAEPMTHVVEAFAEWRAVRRAREPTPERLQRLAAALLADHRAFHICKALRINATALKQWAANLPDRSSREHTSVVASSTDQAVAFVELPGVQSVPHSTRYVADRVSGLVVDLPSGTRLTLNDDMAIETLSMLLQALPPHLIAGSGEHT